MILYLVHWDGQIYSWTPAAVVKGLCAQIEPDMLEYDGTYSGGHLSFRQTCLRDSLLQQLFMLLQLRQASFKQLLHPSIPSFVFRKSGSPKKLLVSLTNSSLPSCHGTTCNGMAMPMATRVVSCGTCMVHPAQQLIFQYPALALKS